MKDSIGDRMKTFYENRARTALLRRCYTIIRVDGKAFHTYCAGLKRPFDDGLMEDMDSTAMYLCKNIMGAKFAFVQSDEISILMTDFEEIGTSSWFDSDTQKVCSISASMATRAFNELRLKRLTAHPLVIVADQKWKSLKGPHRPLTLEDLGEWLAKRVGLDYQHVDPLKVDFTAVTEVMSSAYATRFAILPIQVTTREVVVATTEPFLRDWEKEIRSIVKKYSDYIRYPIRMLLLEKEDAPARHQTGHNSGVIHAGVYYTPGSLKAKFCLAGKRATKAFCDQHGILLICDEIQSGFCRTGKTFATEYSGVEPDIMTLAKSLAGGFPLSAVVGKAEIMNSAKPGGLGGTYAGSPIACAAALAVLQVIDEEKLNQKALDQGEQIKAGLERIAERFDCIGQIRGPGAMVAMELVKQRDASQPGPDLTKRLVAEAGKRGLVLLSCGVRANVIRFLAPLTAPAAVIDEGLQLLEKSLEAVLA